MWSAPNGCSVRGAIERVVTRAHISDFGAVIPQRVELAFGMRIVAPEHQHLGVRGIHDTLWIFGWEGHAAHVSSEVLRRLQLEFEVVDPGDLVVDVEADVEPEGHLGKPPHGVFRDDPREARMTVKHAVQNEICDR